MHTFLKQFIVPNGKKIQKITFKTLFLTKKSVFPPNIRPEGCAS